MDMIFDLITLPFQLIGNSLECMFGCLFIVGATFCCIGVIGLSML